jgi:hypothetical protein
MNWGWLNSHGDDIVEHLDENNRKFFAERLDTLWGRYVAFVNFVVTIAGGTVLALVFKLVELRIADDPLANVPLLVWIALCIAIFSAIYAILWRALAQRYMEYEILTPFGTMEAYFGNQKAHHYVANPGRFEAAETKLMRTAFKKAPFIIASGLFVSWSLIGYHLATLLQHSN